MTIDYTQIENYDCPQCEWSLHIEKTVWTEFSNHQDILDYIKDKVNEHIKVHGGGRNKLHPITNNITDYSNTPYVGYSASPSSLTILE
jgi:hypothetical protein